jgi:uncharacterized protein (UPF0332 family)
LNRDLIVTARRLARANPKRPRQADLRRAVSTAYYAAFHALARECADRFVGTGRGRSRAAWRQTYRSLEHGFAKDACKQTENLGFPLSITDFAEAFVQLQEERHRADYDPDARYTRAEVQVLIVLAEQAATSLRNAPMNDRTAFAVLVLTRRRR